MIEYADIEAALRRDVPEGMHERIPDLSRKIVDTLSRINELGSFEPIARGEQVTDDGTRALLRHLAGREVSFGRAVLAFGQGNQFGDITIHNLAGGDIVHNIAITVVLPDANSTPRPPSDVLASRERDLVESMRKRLQTLLPHTLGSGSRRRSVLVPTTARARSTDGRVYKVNSLLRAHERLLLVGEGGAGKTTALMALAVRAAADFLGPPRQPQPKLPVYVDLRLVSQSLRGLVLETLHPLGLDSAGIDEMLRQGRFLFLIDGLNELPERVRDATIEDLARLTHPLGPYRDNRVIVTTRPLENISLFRGMPVFEIQGFGRAEVREYIWRYFAHSPPQAERLLAQLGVDDEHNWARQYSITSLATNPMILSWIAELSTSARYVVPSRKSRLVADLVRKRLEWEGEYGRAHAFRFADKERALSSLAHMMITSTSATTFAPLDEVKEFFNREWPHGEAMLDEIIANGLLRVSDDRRGIVWMHQLIQDFFGARWLEQALRQGIALDTLSMTEWEDGMVLLAGLLPSPDAYIEQVAAYNPFVAARCYCAAEQFAQRTRLRSTLVCLLSSHHLSVWTLRGDIQQIAAVVQEEALVSHDADTFVLLGKLLESLGRYEEALGVYKQIDDLPHISVDRRFEVLCNEANLQRRVGSHQLAIELLTQAEQIALEAAYHSRDDLLYYELGYIYEKEGEVRKAIAAYNRSLKAGLAIGKSERGHIAAAQAGVVLGRSGHYGRGERLLQRSLEVFELAPERNLRWIFNVRAHLIEFAIASGDFRRAQELIAWAAKQESPTGTKRGHSVDRLRRQGHLAYALQDYRPALSYYREALDIIESGPTFAAERVSELLYALGLCQLALGRRDQALQLFHQSLQQPIAQLNAWGISRAALKLAMIAAEEGDQRATAAFAGQSSRLARTLYATWRAQAQQLLAAAAAA